MRISDWSSDVCSSDLPRGAGAQAGDRGRSADGLPRGPTVRRRPRRIVEAGDLRHPEPQSPGWPRAAKAADAGGALQDHRTTDRDWLLFPAGTPDSRCHLDHLLRSEEHTSELQSLMRISYAVFCLKKKNKHTKHANNHNN